MIKPIPYSGKFSKFYSKLLVDVHRSYAIADSYWCIIAKMNSYWYSSQLNSIRVTNLMWRHEAKDGVGDLCN